MTPALLIGALIMTATAVTHVVMGYSKAMQPLRHAPMSRLSRAVSDLVWQAVTVALVSTAGALFWLSWHHNPALLGFVSALQLGFAGLFLWYGVTRLGSLWIMPQWIIFLGVPALTVWSSV